MPASQFANLLVDGRAVFKIVPSDNVEECAPNYSAYVQVVVNFMGLDCNGNRVDDACDVESGSSPDCNSNGTPDICDVRFRTSGDCNGNYIPDECDIADGVSEDCNGDGIPDECDPFRDCNANGIHDICDIASGSSGDCNDNGVPDDCEPDEDCNNNGTSDICDIGTGTSSDGNLNQVPDECEPDCNENGLPDESDIITPALGLHIPLPASLPPGFTATLFANGLFFPQDLVVSEGGAFGEFLYVEELGPLVGGVLSNRITRIGTNGATSLFKLINSPNGMTLGRPGVFDAGLYLISKPRYLVWIDEFGVRTNVASGGLHTPKGVAFGFDGLIYTKDTWKGGITSVSPSGVVRMFNDSELVSRSSDIISGRGPFVGFLYVAKGSTIYRIDSSGELSVFVSSLPGSANGITFASGGPFGTDMYATAHGSILRIDSSGNAAVFASGFDGRLQGIAFGHGGVLGHDMYVVQTLIDNTGGVIRIRQPRSQDCNANSTPDECDISSGVSLDENANGIPDECCFPATIAPVTVAGPSGTPVALSANRFLLFSVSGTAQLMAVRVTFEDLPAPFDRWNGARMWVGSPGVVSESGASVTPIFGIADFTAASLGCQPVAADWSALGPIHVFHEGIVPGGTYTVEVADANCDLTAASTFSGALTLTTAIWGDTVLDLSEDPPLPPNGPPVDVVDALGVLGAFSNALGAIIKARADLEPACVDLTINVSDVLSSLSGFSGLTYPFTPSAIDPCESVCLSPLPD